MVELLIQEVKTSEVDYLIDLSKKALNDSPWFQEKKLFCPNKAEELRCIKNTLLDDQNKSWKVETEEILCGLLTTRKMGKLLRIGSGDREPAILKEYRTMKIGCALIQEAYTFSQDERLAGIFTTFKSPLNARFEADYHFNLYQKAGMKLTSKIVQFGVKMKYLPRYYDKRITFERAKLDDLDLVVDLILNAFESNKKFQYDPLTNNAVEVRNFQKVWLGSESDSKGIIAYFNGHPVGYCGYKAPIKKNPPCGLLGIIGVVPAYQKKNIGKAMIQKFHNDLIEQGFRYAFVGTSVYNLPALNLYTSMGYHPVYHLFFFYRVKQAANLPIIVDRYSLGSDSF